MKASITGIHGFIGSALNKRLLDMGWETFSYIRPDVDYVFLFGSASSNILFDRNLDKSISDTINGFLDAARFCRDHKIKLFYPSSATIHNNDTTYAHCKTIIEELHSCYMEDVDLMGFRIYAGYGPGERHKGDYASVIYQFCKQMKHNERPIIFGDGTQSRDFIFIDDIVDNILIHLHATGVCEVGTAESTDFNTIVQIINEQLGKDIKPIYAKKPDVYIEETICPYSTLDNPISIKEGIRRILNDPTL